MTLLILQQANDSLRRSLRYLSSCYSEQYLLGLRRKVMNELEWLRQHPHAGQFEPELQPLSAGHRRHIVGPFKIIYLIEKDRIVITDIFDARRDPRKMRG